MTNQKNEEFEPTIESRQIRRAIDTVGISTAAFARMVGGISRMSMGNYLHGKRRTPEEVINRMAYVLDINPDWFYGKDDGYLIEQDKERLRSVGRDFVRSERGKRMNTPTALGELIAEVSKEYPLAAENMGREINAPELGRIGKFAYLDNMTVISIIMSAHSQHILTHAARVLWPLVLLAKLDEAHGIRRDYQILLVDEDTPDFNKLFNRSESLNQIKRQAKIFGITFVDCSAMAQAADHITEMYTKTLL